MAEPGRQENRVHPKLGERTEGRRGGGEEGVRRRGCSTKSYHIRDHKCHPGKELLALRIESPGNVLETEADVLL